MDGRLVVEGDGVKVGSIASEEFQRIDRIQSVMGIGQELERLDCDVRKRVILIALKGSRHQFTWSFYARKFGVPEAEWPRHQG